MSTLHFDDVPGTTTLEEFEVFLNGLEKHFELLGSLALGRKKFRARIQRYDESVSEYLAAFHHKGILWCLRPKS